MKATKTHPGAERQEELEQSLAALGPQGSKELSVKMSQHWDSLTSIRTRRKTRLERTTEKTQPHSKPESTVFTVTVGPLTGPAFAYY